MPATCSTRWTRSPQVFIDGRADGYGEEIFSDYGKIARNRKEREQLLEDYAIDWIIFGKDSALVSNLLLTNSWQMVFDGELYAVLVRKE